MLIALQDVDSIYYLLIEERGSPYGVVVCFGLVALIANQTLWVIKCQSRTSRRTAVILLNP